MLRRWYLRCVPNMFASPDSPRARLLEMRGHSTFPQPLQSDVSLLLRHGLAQRLDPDTVQLRDPAMLVTALPQEWCQDRPCLFGDEHTMVTSPDSSRAGLRIVISKGGEDPGFPLRAK